MCDTVVRMEAEATWFAKNSDREPDEPQPVVRIAAVRGDASARVRTTHVDIPQVPDRNAVILSRPSWCWGAEMGVNEFGVAIGNEAIFSRRRSRAPALLGMDLVRLGLERAESATAAVEVITALLEAHGQGGAAGYRDRGFHYDSSFLVADAAQAWVLETAGRSWAARRVRGGHAISNRLALGRDYERCSADLSDLRPDFAARFDTRLLPWLAGAQERQRAGDACAAADGADFARFAAHLRSHHRGNRDPRDGSNRDVCMHARGFVRRHQTTGSMIARIGRDGLRVVFTGTSAPCLSIFRPVAFGGRWSVLTPPEQEANAPLWMAHEAIHRRALADLDFRDTVRVSRAVTEAQVFNRVQAGDAASMARADRLCAAWQVALLKRAVVKPPRLPRFWARLQKGEVVPPAALAEITRAAADDETLR